MSRQISIGTDPDSSVISIPEDALKQHAVVFGGSGFGKTYFSYVLATEQLRRGASVVMIDYKREGIRRLLGACEQLRIPPERVNIIDSAEQDQCPGMNPFLVNGVHPAESAADFLTLFARSVGKSGPRMGTFLDHAVRIAAWHKLTIFEIPNLLLNQEFREATMREPTDYPKNELYQMSRSYFLSRYTAYSDSDRNSSVQAVEVALDNFARSLLLVKLFNAPRNTVDLDAFFTEQRILLVNFSPGGGMDESSGQFLAAFVVNQLMTAAARVSMRRPADRIPVVLMADEFRKISGFMEEGLRDVANMSRERGIRLLIAAQHPDQIPEGMRADLRVSSAVKAFFNPGDDTTDSAAKYLATVCPEPMATEEEETEEEADYSHLKPYLGKVVAEDYRYQQAGLMEVKAAKKPKEATMAVDPNDTDGSIRRFMAAVPHALPPLYLPDGSRVSALAEQLPDGHVTLMWKDGIAYVDIDVPKPRRKDTRSKPTLSAREFWNMTLHKLRTGQAVVNVTGQRPDIVDIVPIAPPADASVSYATDVVRAQDSYAQVSFGKHLSDLTSMRVSGKETADDSII